MRISLPSLDGLRPRLEARIDFSIAPVWETSQGCTVISDRSGTWTLPSISFTFLNACPAGSGCDSVFICSVDEGADFFAHRHSHYIPGCIQIENTDGQLVVAAHGDGGRIHDAKAFREDLEIAHLVV